MSFATLPIELVDQITIRLENEDQVSFAATAKRYKDIVQRVLYRHITLDPLYNNLECVYSLANNPVIALHVRSFVFRMGQERDVALLHGLQTAISNMTKLTALDIHVEDLSDSWIVQTPETSSYDSLEMFTCSFNLDDCLSHFLNKTPSVTRLILHSLPTLPSEYVSSLRPDALPLLSQFHGSAHAAQFVVPGRPVRDIHLASGDLTEEVARSLAYSTGPVKELSAVTSSHSVSLIGALTRCVVGLVHLRLVTHNFEDAPDLAYISKIAGALRLFPCLQTCEIWGFHWVSSKKGLNDEDREWHSETFNMEDVSNDNNTLDDVSNGNTLVDVSTLFFHHPH